MADEQVKVPDEGPDIHFEPIVKLTSIETKTLEEDEEILFKIRAKLYRYDTSSDEPEWKERGTGEVKFLKHKTNPQSIRVLMRRDKTLKICANHFVTPDLELMPMASSEKAWVYSTPGDFSDEEVKHETLAIRFANVENAKKFKDTFEDCKKKVLAASEEKKDEEKEATDENKTIEEKSTEEKSTEEKSTDDVAEKLGEMSVKDEDKDIEEKKDWSEATEDAAPTKDGDGDKSKE